VGAVHPGWGRFLKLAVTPRPDSTGVDIFLINISTQSETFTEVLQFRRHKTIPQRWAYRYWVTKFKELKNGSASVPVYDRSQWDDDIMEANTKKKDQ
jgi:hypothetical protein